MSTLTPKTGPGDTELLARSSTSAISLALEFTACPLEPPCQALHRRTCGACLRQAVENAQREDLREKLELALHARRQFWMDTCRNALEMRTSSRQALELHRQHGCRFCVPAPPQVQSILGALDSALPGWDRCHPELFYRTLELNFPELLRVGRAQRRG